MLLFREKLETFLCGDVNDMYNFSLFLSLSLSRFLCFILYLTQTFYLRCNFPSYAYRENQFHAAHKKHARCTINIC